MGAKPQRTRGSIDDVAREAGVSPSTASRVLRDLRKVLPETRDKIFAAAEKVGYRPNVMARALRHGGMKTVALVLSPELLAGDYYADAITVLQREFSSQGLRLIISVLGSEENPVELVEELSAWCQTVAVGGLASIGSEILGKLGPDVIGLDWVPLEGEEPPTSHSFLGFDEAEAVRAGVEHLAGLGHRNIAYFGGPPDQHSYLLREQGFLRGMREALLPVRPEWIFRCAPDEEDGSATAAFAQAISGARCRLTALICASDRLALDLMAAIRRHGKQVPDDFSVIGYGNTMAARLANPQLTTIHHPGRELGQALAALILHSSELERDPGGEEHGSSPARRGVVLPAQLIVRDTTAPPRRALALQVPPEAPRETDSLPAGAVVLPDGIYELEARHSGMLLDVPNAARTPGCHVWQWKRNGTSAQLWLITHVGGGWHRLRNVGSWLYLDADRSSPGVCPVVTMPTNEEEPAFQLWKFEPMAPGSSTYKITNKAKELVVDFAYGSLVSNELVIVYPWNGNACQQWTAGRIPVLTDEYEIVAGHSSLALDVPGQSRAAGIVPCQAERTRSLGQRWRLIHRGAACYQVQSMLSNLVLQASRQPSPRVLLTQIDPEAGDAQLWRIEPSGGSSPSYSIVSKALDLALEIAPPAAAPGTPLHLGPRSGKPHQQWFLYGSDEEG